MPEPMFNVAPPRKERRIWLRILVWPVVGLSLLLVAAYFAVTSPAILKGVVLPRLSNALHANVTVTSIIFRPFKQIELQDLKVQAKGQPPALIVPELDVQYRLWDILRGNLRVDEVALVSPTVQLVENPDGTSNLDPLLKALSGKPPAPPKPRPAKPSKPPQIDLSRLALSDARILKIRNYAGGRRDQMELTNLNITLTNLQNGQSAALQLSAALRIENHPPDGRSGFLAAAIKGDFQFALAADLKPASASGEAHLDVSDAGGVFQDFSTSGATLNCDMTPAAIKQVLLRFQKGGAPLGELAVSGPLDLEKSEGRLQVELRGIDKRLLNLSGAAGGLDFGTTTINSTNEIILAKAGSAITAAGRFNANQFQVTRAGQTTPMLDFSADYDVTVDNAAQTASLHKLTLTGTQVGRALLDAHLSRPMSVAWGTGSSGVGESALNLTLTNLNLADWKPFLGENPPAGIVNLEAQLVSQQNGGRLTFDVASQIADLTANVGGSRMVPAAVSLQARGQATDFKQFKLSQYQVQVTRPNQPLLTASGSGAYDVTNASAEAQVTLQASLAGLAGAFAQPGSSVTSGTLELQGHVTQKQNVQTVTGQLVLSSLTGQVGKNSFQDFGSKVDMDVRRTPEQIEIRKFEGALARGGNPGGDFNLTGFYDPARKTVQLTAALAGFNQDGLGWLLGPMLADKQLVAIAVNGSAAIQYDPATSSAIKADLLVTNLIVRDPKGQFPATPLAAKMQIDTALRNQAADIRQFQLGLTPTDRAQNQVQLQGNVDFSKTNAIQGNLKLVADSLDLTRYYDLFAGGTNAGSKTSSATTPQTGSATTANQEPPPANLPLQNFTLAASIGRLYLREVAITNLQATVKADGGRVTIQPLQFVLNGAPVDANADLDLSVPGYKYNFAFDADQVPFAPLVNSFMPDRKGELAGTLSASAQLAGAGITAVNWQKNLAGPFKIGVTNLELSINNARSSLLRSLINVVATIPQLVSNPESGILSLFGQLTGQRSGLVNQFQEAPIEVIAAQGQAGGGQINLSQATVQSSAFKADARGNIVLAPVLTNSTINIPISVSVSQPIAKQLNLAAADSSDGAAYVPLPQFVTMTRTLGDPKTEIKKSALVGLTVRSLGSGLLNQATNPASPVRSLLDQFLQHAR